MSKHVRMIFSFKKKDFPEESFINTYMDGNVKKSIVDNVISYLTVLGNLIHSKTQWTDEGVDFDGEVLALQYDIQPSRPEETAKEIVRTIWKLTNCYIPINVYTKEIIDPPADHKLFNEQDYDEMAEDEPESVQDMN